MSYAPGALWIALVAALTMWLTSCSLTREDCTTWPTGEQRCIRTGMSVIQYPPDTSTVQTVTVDGTYVDLGFQGLGIRFGYGGASTMVSPPEADLEIVGGAKVDAEGQVIGAERAIRAGQYTDEPAPVPTPSLFDRLFRRK